MHTYAVALPPIARCASVYGAMVMMASFAHVVADIGKADFFAPGLQALARLLPKSGAMSESEARTLVDTLTKQSDDGTYFGASNFYSYVATRS